MNAMIRRRISAGATYAHPVFALDAVNQRAAQRPHEAVRRHAGIGITGRHTRGDTLALNVSLSRAG